MPEAKMNNVARPVLVIGDVAVDIVVPYPKFKNPERTLVEFPTPTVVGGGTCANTAVALSRLGQPVEFMGTVGQDAYGRHILEDFKAEGVGSGQLVVDPALNTVGVFAFVDDRGERYLWGWPRHDQAFKYIDPAKVDLSMAETASFVHSSGMAIVHDESARHTITEVFRRAWEAGVPTAFDLNLRVDDGVLKEEYKQAVLEIIRYSRYLLGSGDDEFYYLGSSPDWMETAQGFATGGRTVVVRMGSEDSLSISDSGVCRRAAYKVTQVDTVGAGDAYNAGFILGLLQSRPLEDCLDMGNAVAGYTVGHMGGRSSPTRPELKAFLKAAGANAGWCHEL